MCNEELAHKANGVVMIAIAIDQSDVTGIRLEKALVLLLGAEWISAYLDKRTFVIVKENKHFTVNACAIFTLTDVEARTAEIVRIARVKTGALQAIEFKPVNVDASCPLRLWQMNAPLRLFR